MSWLSRLFSHTGKESVVLIDVNAGSVAGGFAHYAPGAPPAIIYSKRIRIEPHDGEAREAAMGRALSTLGDALIREGAPALARATGSGRTDSILVSVNAPWQKTTLRTDRFEAKRPFTFTKRMLGEAAKKAAAAPAGKLLVDESVIATQLNGYETQEPFGKRVTRAEVLLLTSFIDERVGRLIAGALRGIFHHEAIYSIAGSSVRYQALKHVFPHEHNAFILDASDPEIIISLVRRRFLVAVSEVSDGAAGTPEWISEVVGAFSELSKRFPLPRTIFLLSEPERTDALKRALSDKAFGQLWLSVDPPKIIPVLPGHITGVKHADTSPPDLALMLMALYWQDHGHED
jgi:hypothetical protein